MISFFFFFFLENTLTSIAAVLNLFAHNLNKDKQLGFATKGKFNEIAGIIF